MDHVTSATDMPLLCDSSQSDSVYDSIDQLLFYQKYVVVTLAAIAALVNGTFLGIVIKGCRDEELPIKRFLLVCNRAAADFVTAVVAFSYVFPTLFYECPEELQHIGCTPRDSSGHPLPLQVAITLNYWTVALSYSGVALLTVYAVKNPLKYKTTLTVRHVCLCILASWIFMLLALVFIYTLHGSGVLGDGEQDGYMAAIDTTFDTNGMIYLMLHVYIRDEFGYWLSDLCDNITRLQPIIMAVLSLAMPVVLLIFAWCSYGLVANALWGSRRGLSAVQSNLSVVLHLGLHLAIFTVTVVFMAMAYLNTIPVVDYCWKAEETRPCLDNPTPYWYVVLNVATSIGWFTRMIADPLIDVLVDGVLRRCVIRMPRKHRLSTFTLSTRDEGHKISLATQKISFQPTDPLMLSRM